MLKKIFYALRFRYWRVLIYLSEQDATTGNWQKVDAKLSKALNLAELLVKDAGAEAIPGAELCLARTLTLLAYSANSAGDKIKSETLRKRASDLRTKHAGSSADREIDALIAKGRLLIKEDKLSEAILLFSEARGLSESKYGIDSARVTPSLDALALAMLILRDFDECERLYGRVLEIREATCEPRDISVSIALVNLAIPLGLKKNFSEVEKLLVRALAILESTEPSLGDTLKAFASAKGDLNKLERFQHQMHGMEHPLGVTLLVDLAKTHSRQGKTIEAESEYRRAIQISEARKHIDALELKGLLEKFAKFLREAGRIDEADAADARAHKLAQ